MIYSLTHTKQFLLEKFLNKRCFLYFQHELLFFPLSPFPSPFPTDNKRSEYYEIPFSVLYFVYQSRGWRLINNDSNSPDMFWLQVFRKEIIIVNAGCHCRARSSSASFYISSFFRLCKYFICRKHKASQGHPPYVKG